MAKGEEVDVAALVSAELEKREKAARRKKDPETMAELIDRIADAVVEKLDAGPPEEEEEEEGERTPLADHALFSPFKRKGA